MGVRREPGEPLRRNGSDAYTVVHLFADMQRALATCFPDRAQMILGALENVLWRGVHGPQWREMRSKAQDDSQIEWEHDVVRVCGHVTLVLDRTANASVRCQTCGRSYPTPADVERWRHTARRGDGHAPPRD